MGERRRGEGVRHVVFADESELDVRLALRRDEREGRASVRADVDVSRCDVARPARREGQNRSVREPGHGRNPRVVGVEDDDAAFAGAGHKLGLGAPDVVDASEFAQVRAGDDEDGRGVRGRD